MRIDGFIPNTALTFVHFMLIFAVPLMISGITFLALSEMTKLQGDVYANPLNFEKFYYANRLNPWWENTPEI